MLAAIFVPLGMILVATFVCWLLYNHGKFMNNYFQPTQIVIPPPITLSQTPITPTPIIADDDVEDKISIYSENQNINVITLPYPNHVVAI